MISICYSQAQVSTRYVDSISFELNQNKRVFLSVKIMNRPFKFFFDTGASTSLLDVTVADSLNIKSRSNMRIEGAGGNESYKIIKNQNVRIGNTDIKENTFSLDDLNRLRLAMDQEFFGIIGYDFLNNQITEINFDQKKIYLYPFGSDLDLSEFQSIDFTFDHGYYIPQFRITISQNQKEIEGTILFDSGSNSALFFNTPFDKEHKLSENAGNSEDILNDNMSKTSMNVAFNLEELHFGNFKFFDVSVTSSRDTTGVSSNTHFMGLLGAPIINRFNWVIDYQNKKLYFKPNGIYDD